jgi:hypothetical protein
MHKKSNVSAFLAFLFIHPSWAFGRVDFSNFLTFLPQKVERVPGKPRKSQQGPQTRAQGTEVFSKPRWVSRPVPFPCRPFPSRPVSHPSQILPVPFSRHFPFSPSFPVLPPIPVTKSKAHLLQVGQFYWCKITHFLFEIVKMSRFHFKPSPSECIKPEKSEILLSGDKVGEKREKREWAGMDGKWREINFFQKSSRFPPVPSRFPSRPVFSRLPGFPRTPLAGYTQGSFMKHHRGPLQGGRFLPSCLYILVRIFQFPRSWKLPCHRWLKLFSAWNQ